MDALLLGYVLDWYKRTYSEFNVSVMHSDYKTILERKLNTDTQVDTYKGLFTQPFNAIFSFECSVSEIDSFLCQQGFQSIHGLWMCMGRCGCVYTTVCIMFVFVPGPALLFVSTVRHQY